MNDAARRSAEPIEFKLERRRRRGRARRDDHPGRRSRHGVDIPHLCYKPGMRPDGNCRACMVEIKGERVLAPSCCRAAGDGHGSRERQRARAALAEDGASSCCSSDMPERVYKPRRRARRTGRTKLGVGTPRFAARDAAGARPLASGDGREPRRLHPVHALRARLPRGAGERRHRLRVPRRRIRRSCSTSTIRWATRRASPAANACRRARPARSRRRTTRTWSPADKKVDSVCPYCGVGCQLTYHVKDNKIVRVEGRDGPANHERLCVKGRFGFDYVHAPASPDQAADPQARACRRPPTSRWTRTTLVRRVPRSDVGGGARRSRPARSRDIRDTHGPQRARRLRLAPRAATRRRTCSRSSCAPASAPTTSTTARACATRRASRRCSKASARARCRTR